MGEVKTAEDKYQNKLQFSHTNGATAQDVTTPIVWNANYDSHIKISPTVSDANWTISKTAITPTGSGSGHTLGDFTAFGGSYTTIIRKGEYIGSDANIRVVSLGEL